MPSARLCLIVPALLLPLAACAAQPASRTFRLTYAATVQELPAGARVLDLWLPYPQSDHHQTVRRVVLHGPQPLEIAREPRSGNVMVHTRVEPPAGPVEVRMEVEATRRENAGIPESLTPEERREYLAAEPLVPLTGPVKALAQEATQGKKSAAEKARAIYEKVTALLRYDKSGTGWGRGDALYACDAKRGNCTDFHALIIGMARSEGIPARFAIGLPLPAQRGAGEIPGYHCWAELHVDGRWIPVDSSEGAKALARGDRARKDYYYGHHDADRLELSRGRNLSLSPPQKGAPLNYFVYPYAEVDGKPHAAVERSFRWEDLP